MLAALLCWTCCGRWWRTTPPLQAGFLFASYGLHPLPLWLAGSQALFYPPPPLSLPPPNNPFYLLQHPHSPAAPLHPSAFFQPSCCKREQLYAASCDPMLPPPPQGHGCSSFVALVHCSTYASLVCCCHALLLVTLIEQSISHNTHMTFSCIQTCRVDGESVWQLLQARCCLGT